MNLEIRSDEPLGLGQRHHCGPWSSHLEGKRDRAEISDCDGGRDIGGIQGWRRDWSWSLTSFHLPEER